MAGFALSSYNLTEDSRMSTERSILSICVVSSTNILRDRELSFYVTPVDGTAIGKFCFFCLLLYHLDNLKVSLF